MIPFLASLDLLRLELFLAGPPQNSSHEDDWIYAKMLMSLHLSSGSVSVSSVENKPGLPSGEQNCPPVLFDDFCRSACVFCKEGAANCEASSYLSKQIQHEV